MRTTIPGLGSLFLVLFSLPLVGQVATTQDSATPEKQFSELLTGSTLAGFYTIENDAPKPDKYHITKAAKATGDNWSVTSTIEYRGFAIPVTLTIPVKWAGDTPVMELNAQEIPGIGTFTARVLFHGDRYIGTWSGGPGHSGVLWGTITHEAPTTRK